MSRTGRAVPLSLPLDSQNLRVLRSLRQNAATLQTRLEALVKLQSQLHELASRPQWEALVPVQGTSSLAYGSGRIVQTDKVTVNLGGGEDGSGSEDDGEQPADSGYWVEYTAEQAEGVALRKAERLQARLANMKSAIADCESSLSQEMGLQGGGVNQNYEVVNEEGLPFVDIQEFEDDDGVPQTLDSTSSDMLSEASLSQLRGATSQYIKPRLAMQMPALLKDADEVVDEAKSPVATLARTAKPTSPPVTTHKKVSFTTETKTDSTTDQKLPVIGSTSALSPSPQKTAGTSGSRNPVTSPVQERPMKGMIVEKDTTRPPPVLTAAERSVRSATGQSEAHTFDGVVSHKGKSVDMSAYLPRSIRGSSASSRPDKGKGRAVEETQPGFEEAEEDELEPEADEGEEFDSEGDDDSDGLYQYDDTDEDEDDNYHIDDILAMREAALQYHARRYDLGAGAGTGPLGGNKRPDEYDELGRLTAADKGGLPFVETFETTDGERPASKFRTGRLQTARMVIPDAPFEGIDISKNVIPGDDLGPYEKEKDKEGQHGDHDLTGMSQCEIETFLRYVKALETGEDIDIIPAVRKDEKPVSDPQPAPPTVKSTQPPSVKTSIVEKSSLAVSANSANSIDPPDQNAVPAEVSEKPKRVSRFRAAREGTRKKA